MVIRIREIAPKWTVAALLLFTQLYAQADQIYQTYDETWETEECADECSNFFWGDVDYLYWTIQNVSNSYPIVLEDMTKIVLCGKKVDTGWRSGVRASFGCWFYSAPCYGTEVNYFILPDESKKKSVHSDGSHLLSLPYFNVVTSAEDFIDIASPSPSFSGTATLKLANEMQGAEWNALAALPSFYYDSQFIVIAGFRYWNFQERLTFTTDSPFNPPHVPDTYITKDEFKTTNNFYGGQLGLAWQYDYYCLRISAKAKIALGAMCESVAIKGHLLTNDYDDFGPVQEYPGGYFALPTNIGKHSQTKFSVIPELNINFGYQLFDWVQIKVGYNAIYVNNVLRAGKQIDHHINPTQAVSYTDAIPPLLMGDPSPKAKLKTSSLWVQGVNAGLEFNF